MNENNVDKIRDFAVEVDLLTKLTVTLETLSLSENAKEAFIKLRLAKKWIADIWGNMYDETNTTSDVIKIRMERYNWGKLTPKERVVKLAEEVENLRSNKLFSLGLKGSDIDNANSCLMEARFCLEFDAEQFKDPEYEQLANSVRLQRQMTKKG